MSLKFSGQTSKLENQRRADTATGPHSRRWAAGDRVKLHLPLPIAPHRSHYGLNHSPDAPDPRKNHLPQDRSLVPKRLGTTALDLLIHGLPIIFFLGPWPIRLSICYYLWVHVHSCLRPLYFSHILDDNCTTKRSSNCCCFFSSPWYLSWPLISEGVLQQSIFISHPHIQPTFASNTFILFPFPSVGDQRHWPSREDLVAILQNPLKRICAIVFSTKSKHDINTPAWVIK